VTLAWILRQRLEPLGREPRGIQQDQRNRSNTNLRQVGCHHRAPGVADDRKLGKLEPRVDEESGHVCRGLHESMTAVPGGCRAVPGHIDCDDPATVRCERRADTPPACGAGRDAVSEQERRVIRATPGEKPPVSAIDL